jgi:hypothetical protein
MAILTRARRLPIAVLLLSLLSLFSEFVSAQENTIQLYEQKIKAGLVYNLLKYTAWPKESALNTTGKLQICLLGEDPFDGYLAPLEGRTAQQTPIAISHIKNTSETEQCSVIIIHRNQAHNLPELLRVIKGKNILTVSDIDQFAQQGGMIEMAKEGAKISLYINKNAVISSGLDIQDPMLKLAKIVSS